MSLAPTSTRVWRRYIKQVGFDVPPATVDALFAEYDPDGSGQIDGVPTQRLEASSTDYPLIVS